MRYASSVGMIRNRFFVNRWEDSKAFRRDRREIPVSIVRWASSRCAVLSRFVPRTRMCSVVLYYAMPSGGMTLQSLLFVVGHIQSSPLCGRSLCLQTRKDSLGWVPSPYRCSATSIFSLPSRSNEAQTENAESGSCYLFIALAVTRRDENAQTERKKSKNCISPIFKSKPKARFFRGLEKRESNHPHSYWYRYRYHYHCYCYCRGLAWRRHSVRARGARRHRRGSGIGSRRIFATGIAQ